MICDYPHLWLVFSRLFMSLFSGWHFLSFDLINRVITDQTRIIILRYNNNKKPINAMIIFLIDFSFKLSIDFLITLYIYISVIRKLRSK